MEISSVNSSSAYAVSQPARSASLQDQRQKDEQALDALKKRDATVRQHEQAHLAAAGSLAQGAASFTYERGSDGQLYAIGGEVSIDASPAATPDATIAKAQQIRAAAQDRSVAAAAGRLELEARAELAQQEHAATGENTQGTTAAPSGSAAERLYQEVQAQPDKAISRLIASA